MVWFDASLRFVPCETGMTGWKYPTPIKTTFTGMSGWQQTPPINLTVTDAMGWIRGK